ncbi:MAG: sugar ABC transporter permease [Chloroflexota bacterium]|nr:sugar ABC transporter permease [Chloroflexota bacterium]
MEAITEFQSRPEKKGAGWRGMSRMARREALTGYLYISPWLIGFLIFTLIPVIASVVFTFTNIRLGSGEAVNFVGLENYRTLFRDTQVWESLLITIKFGLIALPVGMILPIILALLMNSAYLYGKYFMRVLFYFPYIIPFVAAIFIWGAIINPETGWLNMALEGLGVKNPPNWLNDPTWVYPALVILGLWGIGNAMLINMAALQGVPTELYDAAKVDGAGFWRTLFNVTLPLISPVIFYNLLLTVVGLFQYFLVPLVLNSGTGAPGGATMFYNLYLYKTFFTYQNMAYGATMGWLLFLVILVVTIFMFWSAKYWVYYAGDSS